MKKRSLKTMFIAATLLSSIGYLPANSLALDIPDDGGAATTGESPSIPSGQPDTQPGDDSGSSRAGAGAMTEEDRKTLGELEKDMAANTDFDTLPPNPTPEQRADYHMRLFTDRLGLMSGIVGLCSPREQALIQECGELVLGNWKHLTGEKPPQDTPERRSAFRTAWAKREIQALLAVRKMSRNPDGKPPSCQMIIQDEQDDDMWKLCKRKFVDHPVENPEKDTNGNTDNNSVK